MKKMTRNVLASPTAAASFAAAPASARARPAAKVTMKPSTKLGNRAQISIGLAFSASGLR